MSMHLLLITNDMVVLSYAQALLAESRIESQVFDRHISLTEGSIGAFPRRLMVTSEGRWRAVQLLREAGLGEYVVDDASG